MSAPVRRDLVVYIGDTWYSDQRWALIVAGAGVDLSDGWTVNAQARANRKDPDILHEWTEANGGIILTEVEVVVNGDPVTTSAVQLKVAAGESDAWDWSLADWDLQVSHPTFDGGELYRRTLVLGTIRPDRDVTRP